MPPPPRPGACARLVERTASNEKTSPYFSQENRNLSTTAKRGEEDERSQSGDKWNKGQSVRPSKDSIPLSAHYESASLAHGPTSKPHTLPVHLVLEQSVRDLEAVGTDCVRSNPVTMPSDEYRERSLSEDEEEKRIHAEASIEKRGFRSAKSLERSIVKRRKLRQ